MKFLLLCLVLVLICGHAVFANGNTGRSPRQTRNRSPVRSPVQAAQAGGRAGGRSGQQQQSRNRLSLAYVMADGVDEVVGPYQEVFSCDGRDYGYYADIANNCKIYHVCVPPTSHFTFFCNNGNCREKQLAINSLQSQPGTIFDQKLMTCQDELRAAPCGDSERFYVLNQNFGVIDNNKLITVE